MGVHCSAGQVPRISKILTGHVDVASLSLISLRDASRAVPMWLLTWWLVYLGDFWNIDSKTLNVTSQSMKLGICGTYIWRLFVQIINDRITLMLKAGSNRPKAGLNFLRHPTQHRQQQQPRAVHGRPLVEHIIFIGFWQMSPLQFGHLLLSKRTKRIVQLNPILQHMDLHGTNPLKPPQRCPLDIEAQQGQHGQWQSPLVSSIASPWKWKSQSWVKLTILVNSSN